jgi:putative serine protease PepD
MWPTNLLLGLAGLVLAVLSGVEAVRGTRPGTPDGQVLELASSAFSAANDAPVVRIVARTCTGLEAGSGVVLGGGLVATARHVVRGATSVTVDGDGILPVTGVVLGVDASGRDIAILRVPDLAGIEPARLGDRDVARGADLAATGHPRGGVRRTLGGAAAGYVDDGPLAADGQRVLTLDAAIEPGMSGGPVLDGTGRLVGIAIGVERNTGTGIAVPVRTIARTLQGDDLAPPPTCER